MTTDNPFRLFYDAGFTRLVPIVPPGVRVSERSALYKRPKALGKAPGVKRPDGLWQGLDWLKHVTTEADLDVWYAMGAGVGIRTGGGLVAVDIDTLDKGWAEFCGAATREWLGDSVVRTGNAPKRLLVYRTAEPIAYRRVLFDDGLPCKPGAEPRVELLSDDRQFVAHGIHPVTGKPYAWPDGLPQLDELPIITEQQIVSFFAYLVDTLPAAAVSLGTSSSTAVNVDQHQLAGDPTAVAAAVAALPNTTALFPTYDDYVRVGYAIKGSLPDDPDRALELFQEWAAKWEGGNDPDVVSADWSRMKPPFEVGAQYLYSLAEKHGSFQAADAWFTDQGPATASADPWADAPDEVEQVEPIRWADLSVWRQQEPPKREWEVEGFIPCGVVTLVYGEGGVGKTLAMHQYAVAAAAGRKWLDQATRPARVMCVFCEDDEDELHRRHRDILRAYGIADGEADERLRIVSRAGEDNLIATFGRSGGELQRTAFWRQLDREVDEWGPDVLILDTIADIYGGSEIDRTQVNQFVKVGIGALGGKRKMTRIALGHPSVAGRAEGRSGSTAWSNAARSRVYLRRPKGKEKGNARELEGMKANRGPVGNLLQIEWKAGAFSLVAASTQIDLNAFKEAGEAAAKAPTVEEREEAAVLAALGAARAIELPLGLSRSAHQKYAPKVLHEAFPDVMALVRRDYDVVDGIIRKLLRTGRVVEAKWRHPEHRYVVKGFEPVTALAAGGVFN